MSIATELQNLNDNILSAYDAVATKGGTVPANKNMANLATAIGSISTGSSTTITPLSVTENGTYTAPTGTAYSPVTVNVSGGESVSIPREVSSDGRYQMPANNFTFSLPANATNLGPYALAYAFRDCTGLTSVDLSSLTKVSGTYALQYAFRGCTKLTSVDLSSLTTVSGTNALQYAFPSCTKLTSVNLSSLAKMSGSQVLNYAFRDCTSLTSLSFPALTTSSFGSATNQFNNMLYGVRGCTVHFPASIQSTIGNWTSVQNGFGGTNTTVLFDL